MNTIISFLKGIDVDILSFITSVAKFLINKLDIALNANKPLYHQYIDPIGLLIGIAIVGLPFVFLIIYFFVLRRRGRKMGITYDYSGQIDDDNDYGPTVGSTLGPVGDNINDPPLRRWC